MGSIELLTRKLGSLMGESSQRFNSKSMSTLDKESPNFRRGDGCLKSGLATPNRTSRNPAGSKRDQVFFEQPIPLKSQSNVLRKNRSRKKNSKRSYELLYAAKKTSKKNSKKVLRSNSKSQSRNKISKKELSSSKKFAKSESGSGYFKGNERMQKGSGYLSKNGRLQKNSGYLRVSGRLEKGLSKKSSKSAKSDILSESSKILIKIHSSEKKNNKIKFRQAKKKSSKTLSKKSKKNPKKSKFGASKTTDLKNFEYEQEKQKTEDRLSLKNPVRRRRKKKLKFLKNSKSRSRDRSEKIEDLVGRHENLDFQKKENDLKMKSYNEISESEPFLVAEKKMRSLDVIGEFSDFAQANHLQGKKELLFPKQLRGFLFLLLGFPIRNFFLELKFFVTKFLLFLFL